MILKKGSIYKNHHISLKNDFMVISSELAKLLSGDHWYDNNRFRGCLSTGHWVSYKGYCKLSIFLMKRTRERVEYCVGGNSGDFGFGDNWCYTGKLHLGVRTQRVAFIYIIEFFKKSNLNREGKLERILKYEK